MYEIAVTIMIATVIYIVYKISRELDEEYTFLRLLFFTLTLWLCLLGISTVTNMASSTPTVINDTLVNVSASHDVLSNLEAFYIPLVVSFVFATFMLVVWYVMRLVESIRGK